MYELRVVIDRARRLDPSGEPDRPALKRLRRLVVTNPTAIRSSHVIYNLGRERAEWLLAFLNHFDAKRSGALVGPHSAQEAK